MSHSVFKYDFKDLKLSSSHIEKVMGYENGEAEETIHLLVEEVLGEAGNACDIRAEYRIFDGIKFTDSDKSAETAGQSFSIKKIVYGQLKKATSVAVFVCTAGPGPGDWSRREMKGGDLLKGYLIDVVGSEIVESAADLMQNSLEDKMSEEGYRITNRFSPGYCGWDVAEQHKLFSLMPDNYCGIRLTPGALMDPVKSVSGFIGIGKNVKRLPYACSLCDMNDCIYRRVKSG